MMDCASATWDDRAGATAAKRNIKRTYFINTDVYLCETCDHYHVKQSGGRHPVSDKWQLVLQCLAQGMTLKEISEQVGLTPRSVYWTLNELRDRFYALNRPHLVAISISLGIVNPNIFIPSLEERNDDCTNV